MQHNGDRLSKARVACLHGDKEKSLLLCSWTEASLSTVRLGAVSAAQEDGRGGDGSFQKRQHTPVQLDEVVRCSPRHDEERAASVQREDPIADVLALVAVCHPLEEG